MYLLTIGGGTLSVSTESSDKAIASGISAQSGRNWELIIVAVFAGASLHTLFKMMGDLHFY